MVKKYITHHIFQYVIILLLFAITVTVLNTPMDFIIKAITIGVTVVMYIFWSIWHHWEDHGSEHTWAIVAEYATLLIFLIWLLFTIAK